MFVNISRDELLLLCFHIFPNHFPWSNFDLPLLTVWKLIYALWAPPLFSRPHSDYFALPTTLCLKIKCRYDSCNTTLKTGQDEEPHFVEFALKSDHFKTSLLGFRASNLSFYHSHPLGVLFIENNDWCWGSASARFCLQKLRIIFFCCTNSLFVPNQMAVLCLVPARVYCHAGSQHLYLLQTTPCHVLEAYYVVQIFLHHVCGGAFALQNCYELLCNRLPAEFHHSIIFDCPLLNTCSRWMVFPDCTRELVPSFVPKSYSIIGQNLRTFLQHKRHLCDYGYAWKSSKSDTTRWIATVDDCRHWPLFYL